MGDSRLNKERKERRDYLSWKRVRVFSLDLWVVRRMLTLKSLVQCCEGRSFSLVGLFSYYVMNA